MTTFDLTSGKPSKWTFLIFLAVVPLLVGTLLLQVFVPVGKPLSAAQLERFHTAVSPEPFLPGAMTYAGMVTIHLFACVAALLFALLVLRSAPGWRALAIIAAVTAVSLSLLILVLGMAVGESIAAYRLTFFATEDLFRNSGAAVSILDHRIGAARPLDIAAFFPTVLGIAAVLAVAAAAVGQLNLLHSQTEASEEEQEMLLCLAHSRIKRCTYALSLVLVTSTVAASLFFELPAKMYLSDAAIGCCIDPSGRILEDLTDPQRESARLLLASKARIEAFAAELTLFWGAIYTLTLMAAVGIPLLLVQKRVLDFLDALKPPERAEDMRARMAQKGAVGRGGEQIRVLIAFVAPLVSAPIASFLQAAAG